VEEKKESTSDSKQEYEEWGISLVDDASGEGAAEVKEQFVEVKQEMSLGSLMDSLKDLQGKKT